MPWFLRIIIVLVVCSILSTMLTLCKSALMLLYRCSSGCFHIVTARGLSVLCFASFCRVCVWFALCFVIHVVCALIRVDSICVVNLCSIFLHTQFDSIIIHSCTDHLSYVPYVDICTFFCGEMQSACYLHLHRVDSIVYALCVPPYKAFV